MIDFMPPDDIDDAMDVLAELNALIMKHIDKMTPAQMAATLIMQGTRVAYIHAIDKETVCDFVAEIAGDAIILSKKYLEEGETSL